MVLEKTSSLLWLLSFYLAHVSYTSGSAIIFKIQLTSESSNNLQKTVAANMPFSPPLQLEILDVAGNRVTTGNDIDKTLRTGLAVELEEAFRTYEDQRYCCSLTYRYLSGLKQNSIMVVYQQCTITMSISTLEALFSSNFSECMASNPVRDITTEIEPAGCLSVDSAFKFKSGLAVFPGSVCQPVQNVRLKFKIIVGLLKTVVIGYSPYFNVSGDIHIANFQKTNIHTDGKLEAFMLGAISDVNTGYYRFGDGPYQSLLPGRTLQLNTYYHQGTAAGGVKAYQEMKKDIKMSPEKRPVGILGFQSDDITKVVLPTTAIDRFPVLSFKNDLSPEFSDKAKYPYFSRIVYSEEYRYHGLVLFLLERQWTKIVLVRTTDAELTSSFYSMMKKYDISILRQYTFPVIADYDKEPKGKFKESMEDISKMGTRVILSYMRNPTATYVFTEAIDAGITSKEGYQWVGMNKAEDFPATNAPLRCRNLNKLCIHQFKGTVTVEPLYLVGGYASLQWQHIWARHVRSDPTKLPGNGITMPMQMMEDGVDYALAYDGVSSYTMAVKDLIEKNETISGPKLSDRIRQLNFDGLTGKIKFNEKGDRGEFKAMVKTLWFHNILFMMMNSKMIAQGLKQPWDYTGHPILRGQFFKFDDSEEVKADGGTFGLALVDWFKDFGVLAGYIERKYTNKRNFTSYKGVLFVDTQQLVTEIYKTVGRFDRAILPFEEISRQEDVPAPFYCTLGCGGNATNPTDINDYPNGKCILQNVCKCKQFSDGTPMYSGTTCGTPVCNQGCEKGSCLSPNSCTCLPGWTSTDCSKAICLNPVCDSVGGNCVAPETCVCKPDYHGFGCSSKCTCENGKCNSGQKGSGKCSTCDSGYMGDNCDISMYAVVLPVVLGTLFLGLSLFFGIRLMLRRAELKAALYNNDWIVNWNDIKRFEEQVGRSSMFMSGMSMNKSVADRNKKQANVDAGTWNGIDIHYQKIDRDSMNLTDDVRMDVKLIRDMTHINLISFVGCCINSPNVAILTEIAPKGSLDDILANEDIKLPWNFRFSLLKGVCNGLEFIHRSEIGSHGRLKSTNCLIDNRWTLKLTGFGLKTFKQGRTNAGRFVPGGVIPDDESLADFGGLLWTAPEILTTGVYHPDHVGYGTREGDIYSFGLIVTEACTREYPFHDVLLEKRDIIDLIAKRRNPEALKVWNAHIAKLNREEGGPVRPIIKDSDWPSKFEKRKALKSLIENCWADDASRRPTIRDCTRELDRIDPQRGELMDRLVVMLERYSSNLEDVVAQRTKELAKEKQKTEDLVARLLPKTVAEDLKQGKKVEPEKFENCTIYFSDIVGFTSIAKASTPLQVVSMLNDMYTCFDSLLGDFDTYKVETIGDAYMVVSGLPIRNGDNHAGEIATLALYLMNAVGDFKISHLPGTQLRLRAGIHTGFVVAGVVGLKMPRYCLFGESVNVAAKMESEGKPLRIHVSDDTAEILRKTGGYHLTYRQEMDVKGRGVLKTWWLTGKDGFDLPMPTPEED